MKRSLGYLAIVPAVAFGLSLSAPAFAQDAGAPSASASTGVTQTMKNAGTDTENAAKTAGTDTADAAKSAYDTTATAVGDTGLTAKVKMELDKNSETEHAHIHVKTKSAVVTLTGHVASAAVSQEAEQIAKGVAGVDHVSNHLKVRGSSSSSNS